MGYFSYFIKCVIRKFVNMLFKPKMVLALLIIIGVLFAMNITARAEWTNDQILDLQADLFDIIFQLTQQVEDLEKIGQDTTVMRQSLTSIDTAVWDISARLQESNRYFYELNSKISTLLNDIDNLNQSINDIYNKLDENQQELLTELEKDNQAVLEELNMIRDSINGTEEEQDTFVDNGLIVCGDQTSGLYRLKSISLNYEPKYTYTIKIYYKQGNSYSYVARVYATDNTIPQEYISTDYWSSFKALGNVPSGTSITSFTYIVPSTNPKHIYFNNFGHIDRIEVYRSIKGITESLNQSNDLQQQQNQLQQESNQLQQEQNNFLSKPSDDSDVSVDSFNNVDSNDITSAGLSGVFNNIYSSITSWNAKNISLPIPYTNKSINIPASYTENMLNSSGGGWIITFIHAVYYFIVGRFMIYGITNIINSIKSGSILNNDSKNNITTDML